MKEVLPLGDLRLAEGSMLLRLRRASLALLCLVGAVGMGLILFIAQLGWPGVFSSPIPGNPTHAGTVHDAIALTRPARLAPAQGQAQGHGSVAKARRGAAAGPDRRARGESRLGGSRELTASNGNGQPDTGVGQPTSTPAPAPAPSEPAPVAPAPPPAPPAPTTTTVASPSPSSPGQTAAKTTGDPSTAKVKSDGSASTGTTASKSQGPRTSKVKDYSSMTPTSEIPAAKANKDGNAASAKAAAPVTAPPKSAAPTPSPATAKEAADAAAGSG